MHLFKTGCFPSAGTKCPWAEAQPDTPPGKHATLSLQVMRFKQRFLGDEPLHDKINLRAQCAVSRRPAPCKGQAAGPYWCAAASAACYQGHWSGEIEGSLPFADGKEDPCTRDGLRGVRRQLDVVRAGHDRGQIAVGRKARGDLNSVGQWTVRQSAAQMPYTRHQVSTRQHNYTYTFSVSHTFNNIHFQPHTICTHDSSLSWL